MNELLQLLLSGQQNQVVDPRGPAILQQLIANPEAFSGNERLSNFNTALDFLSPGAAASFQEQSTPDLGQVGAQLGLSPEELDQVIRQATGLQLSPLQAQEGQASILSALPQFMTAQARQAEVPIKQQEADVKGREVTVKEDAEARLREQLETLDPEQQNQMFDLAIKNMALTGKDLSGNQLPPELFEGAKLLLRKGQADPASLELFKGLVKAGEFEIAGQLLGLPEDAIKQGFFIFGSSVAEGTKLPGVGGGTTTQSAAPRTEEERFAESDKLLRDFLQGNLDALDQF